jgi:hypothetical protein
MTLKEYGVQFVRPVIIIGEEAPEATYTPQLVYAV